MQQYYGDNVHIIQKNKNRKKSKNANPPRKKAFCFLVILLSLIALFCAVFYPFNSSAKTHLKSKTWHYVTVRFSTEHLESELASENVKEKGGGGFILNDGTFVITATVFENESDAKSVASKIENGKVYSLTVPQISVSEQKDTKEIRNALSVYQKVYRELTAVVTDYDEGKSTDSVAMLVLGKMRDLVVSVREGIENDDEKLYEATRDFLVETEKTLSFAISDEEHTIPARIRYAVSKMVYDRYRLAKSLI